MLYGEYTARVYAHTRRIEHEPRSDRAAGIDSRKTEPYNTLRHSDLVSLTGSHATGWRLNIGHGGITTYDESMSDVIRAKRRTERRERWVSTDLSSVVSCIGVYSTYITCAVQRYAD